MQIAILGDLHGRIYEALNACRQWEIKNSKQIDIILQLGDLGVWPFPERADKATRTFAEKYSSEYGFREFHNPSERVKKLLSELKANLIFVTGNHEDFQYLAECTTKEPVFSIEPLKRIYCLKNGQVYNFKNIKIAGLGGLDAKNRPGKYLPEAYIQKKDAKKLLKEKFDIFISHESPKDAAIQGSGSEEITRILKKCQPEYAFFAHYREAPETITISDCKTKIHHVHAIFHKKQTRIGILNWEKKEFNYD